MMPVINETGRRGIAAREEGSLPPGDNTPLSSSLPLPSGEKGDKATEDILFIVGFRFLSTVVICSSRTMAVRRQLCVFMCNWTVNARACNMRTRRGFCLKVPLHLMTY